MREEDTIKHVDFVAFTMRHHGGDEIPRPVVAEARSLLPRRTIVGAADVSNMMLEAMLLKPQGGWIAAQKLCNQRANIFHLLLAPAQADEVQQLGRIRQSVTNLPLEISV